MASLGKAVVEIEAVVRIVLGGKPDRSQSPCHKATIDCSLADGVLTGSCAECGETVVRLGQDGEEEWFLLPLVEKPSA